MDGVVWITGASSGIGRALASKLAREGRRVVVSARRAEALSALVAETGGNAVALPLDTTDAAACEAAVARIEAEVGPLGLAVLNAGTHVPTPARDFAVAPVRLLVETNLMGTVNCLAPALAAMRARKRGHIAVVASVAGYGGLPTAAAYGATKAALVNMCEALKPECDALGVKLQLVSPGFVRTPLTDRNAFPMPFLMDADAAARAFVAGLASDRFEIVFPRRLTFVLKLLNMLPYGLYFRLVRRATGL
jgi:short-subunit dehydrogenase